MANAVPMLAGVGLQCGGCISSSVAAAMMGGEKTPETAEAAPLPKGQYVILENIKAYDADAEGNDDDKHKIINLAEVEVFALGSTTSLPLVSPWMEQCFVLKVIRVPIS